MLKKFLIMIFILLCSPSLVQAYNNGHGEIKSSSSEENKTKYIKLRYKSRYVQVAVDAYEWENKTQVEKDLLVKRYQLEISLCELLGIDLKGKGFYDFRIITIGPEQKAIRFMTLGYTKPEVTLSFFNGAKAGLDFDGFVNKLSDKKEKFFDLFYKCFAECPESFHLLPEIEQLVDYLILNKKELSRTVLPKYVQVLELNKDEGIKNLDDVKNIDEIKNVDGAENEQILEDRLLVPDQLPKSESAIHDFLLEQNRAYKSIVDKINKGVNPQTIVKESGNSFVYFTNNALPSSLNIYKFKTKKFVNGNGLNKGGSNPRVYFLYDVNMDKWIIVHADYKKYVGPEKPKEVKKLIEMLVKRVNEYSITGITSTEEKIQELDFLPEQAANDVKGSNKFDVEWQKNYNLLFDYINKNGMLPKQKTIVKDLKGNEVNIGSWINYQRASYDKEKLSEYRVQKLEELPGWSWGKSYKASTLPITTMNTFGEDVSWVIKAESLFLDLIDGRLELFKDMGNSKIRLLYRYFMEDHRLVDDDVLWEKFQLLPEPLADYFIFEAMSERNFYINNEILARFNERDLSNPSTYNYDADDIWASEYNPYIDMNDAGLPSTGVPFSYDYGSSIERHTKQEFPENEWNNNFIIAKHDQLSTGVLPSLERTIPVSDWGIVDIGIWIRAQFHLYNAGILSKERMDLLETLPGFVDGKWPVIDPSVKYRLRNSLNFQILKGYMLEKGSIPTGDCVLDGIKIGKWVLKMLDAYQKSKLSPDLLEGFGELSNWEGEIKKLLNIPKTEELSPPIDIEKEKPGKVIDKNTEEKMDQILSSWTRRTDGGEPIFVDTKIQSFNTIKTMVLDGKISLELLDYLLNNNSRGAHSLLTAFALMLIKFSNYPNSQLEYISILEDHFTKAPEGIKNILEISSDVRTIGGSSVFSPLTEGEIERVFNLVSKYNEYTDHKNQKEFSSETNKALYEKKMSDLKKGRPVDEQFGKIRSSIVEYTFQGVSEKPILNSDKHLVDLFWDKAFSDIASGDKIDFSLAVGMLFSYDNLFFMEEADRKSTAINSDINTYKHVINTIIDYRDIASSEGLMNKPGVLFKNNSRNLELARLQMIGAYKTYRSIK